MPNNNWNIIILSALQSKISVTRNIMISYIKNVEVKIKELDKISLLYLSNTLKSLSNTKKFINFVYPIGNKVIQLLINFFVFFNFSTPPNFFNFLLSNKDIPDIILLML